MVPHSCKLRLEHVRTFRKTSQAQRSFSTPSAVYFICHVGGRPLYLLYTWTATEGTFKRLNGICHLHKLVCLQLSPQTTLLTQLPPCRRQQWQALACKVRMKTHVHQAGVTREDLVVDATHTPFCSRSSPTKMQCGSDSCFVPTPMDEHVRCSYFRALSF